MRLILWAMALFSLAGIVFSSKNADGKVPSVSIHGGTPAARGEFPYLAALHLDGAFCGGSLIGPSHVLTAGHCLDSNQSYASKYTVYLNTLKDDGSTAGAITRKVKKFIVHPKPSPDHIDNDIALLVLSSPVTTIKPIPLPTTPPTTTKPTTKKPGTTKVPTKITTPFYSCTCAPTTPAAPLSGYANMNAVIAGWGVTSPGVGSDILLKANVTVLDDSVCTSQYGSLFYIGHELCAFAPGRESCSGDSGGPIIVNGVLVGTTSWSGGSCSNSSTYAVVYSRITNYLNWIKTNMANNPG